MIPITLSAATSGKLALANMLKGDPDGWSVLKEGILTKAREILPGKNE